MKADTDVARDGRRPWSRILLSSVPSEGRRAGSRPLMRILWWAGYILCAFALQQRVSGLDALTPGFLLALQEKKTAQTVWLFLLFTLIQEGAGTLHFGMAMLWYGGQIALFHLHSRLFVADNILFVIFLSANLGGYYGILLWLLCTLQDVPVDSLSLLHASLVQTLAIPLIWGIAWFFSLKAAPHVH